MDELESAYAGTKDAESVRQLLFIFGRRIQELSVNAFLAKDEEIEKNVLALRAAIRNFRSWVEPFFYTFEMRDFFKERWEASENLFKQKGVSGLDEMQEYFDKLMEGYDMLVAQTNKFGMLPPIEEDIYMGFKHGRPDTRRIKG